MKMLNVFVKKLLRANKTAQWVMAPVAKLFHLSSIHRTHKM